MKALFNPRIVTIALVALFTVAFTAPALANNEKDAAPVELKYLGKYNNQPVFEVSFVNAKVEGSEYIVVIRDSENNVLYKDVVKPGTLTRKYLLDTENVSDVAVQFEITEKKSNKTSVYAVNKSSRIVEDLAVNKL